MSGKAAARRWNPPRKIGSRLWFPRPRVTPCSQRPLPAPACPTLTRPAAETLARTLRLVADPTRLQLLSMINGSPGQEVTVGELTQYLGLRQPTTQYLGLRQPTISHHLRLMYEDGLLDREQRGRHVWYSIAEDRRGAIADLLR